MRYSSNIQLKENPRRTQVLVIYRNFIVKKCSDNTSEHIDMNAETSKALLSSNTKKDSENSGSTLSHSDSRKEENCKITRKRKSCCSLEPPRKRQRGPEVTVEAEVPRRTTRRASSPIESPRKRRRECRSSAEVTDAAEVSAEAATAKGTKRRASSAQDSPKKRRKPDTSTNNSESSGRRVDTETSCSTSSESSSDSYPSSCNVVHFNRSITKFESKYIEIFKIGEGGFGSVYAGYRKADVLPVAIKHIPKENGKTRWMDSNGKTYMVPTEVIMMIRAAGGPEEIGQSAAVTLLDWFDLEQEDILVMERPVPAMDLYDYLYDKIQGPMEESLAKNIMKQLVEAAISMHSRGVFHRDIKLENCLIETGCDFPRVRIIDFGCARFLEKGPCHKFAGTSVYGPPEFDLLGRYEADPTTVWQLGALLYELLTGDKQFSTSRFLSNKRSLLQDIRGLSVSEDCYNFFRMCAVVDPKERATLKQMQQHPWLKKCCSTLPPNTTTFP